MYRHINKIINCNDEHNLQITEKIIAWVVILFMPLSIYTTPIYGITIGDITLFLLLPLLIIDSLISERKFIVVFPKPIFIFMLFIVVHSCINLLWVENINNFKILAIFRYLFYLFMVLVISSKQMKIKSFISIYKMLALIFVFYAIAQFITFKLYGYPVLPPNLLGIPTVDYIDNISDFSNIALYGQGLIYRPRSVFLEPAYFSTFLAPILFYTLNLKNDIKSSLVLSLGVIVSGSTTGMVFLVLFWSKFILTLFASRKFKLRGLIFIFASIILTFYLSYYYLQDYLQIIFNNILQTDGTLGSTIIQRFQNYDILTENYSNIITFFIGNGMTNVDLYLPSYGVLFYRYGFLGIMVYLIAMIYTYCNCGFYGKGVTFILFLLCFGTNSFFNISSVLLLTLIYLDYGGKKI